MRALRVLCAIGLPLCLVITAAAIRRSNESQIVRWTPIYIYAQETINDVIIYTILINAKT